MEVNKMLKLKNNGQALVEYLLIIAVVSVVVVSIVKLLGGYLQDSMTKSSCTLVDKVYVEGERPGEGRCEDR
jgi:Flp pilus assembly pilin Flp